jgi:flagellar basal body rod protein FlgC
MDHFKAAEISAAGMAAQQARIEAATLNIANMYSSIAPGAEGYRPLKAVIHSTLFARAFEPEVVWRSQERSSSNRPASQRAQRTSRVIRTPMRRAWCRIRPSITRRK